MSPSGKASLISGDENISIILWAFRGDSEWQILFHIISLYNAIKCFYFCDDSLYLLKQLVTVPLPNVWHDMKMIILKGSPVSPSLLKYREHQARVSDL